MELPTPGLLEGMGVEPVVAAAAAQEEVAVVVEAEAPRGVVGLTLAVVALHDPLQAAPPPLTTRL